MPLSTIDSQIQARIDEFVQELSGLIREAALEAVQEALGGTATPAKRGPGRRKGVTRKKAAKRGGRKKAAKRATRKTSKKAGARKKRSSAAVQKIAERALAHVKKKPGVGAIEIAKALRMTSKDVQRPLQILMAEKKVRTTGQRRGTKYHPK